MASACSVIHFIFYLILVLRSSKLPTDKARLLSTVVKTGNMKTETRFRLFRIYFGTAGNPIFGDGQSVASRMHMVASVITVYGFWMGTIIETLRKLKNFEEAFENARLSIILTACCWLDLFMRYRY
jgi:hypothetical protein